MRNDTFPERRFSFVTFPCCEMTSTAFVVSKIHLIRRSNMVGFLIFTIASLFKDISNAANAGVIKKVLLLHLLKIELYNVYSCAQYKF